MLGMWVLPQYLLKHFDLSIRKNRVSLIDRSQNQNLVGSHSGSTEHPLKGTDFNILKVTRKMQLTIV